MTVMVVQHNKHTLVKDKLCAYVCGGVVPVCVCVFVWENVYVSV